MPLITLQQQQQFKPISLNNALEYNQIETETVEKDLTELLGAAMVAALLKAPTSERMLNILNEKEFEDTSGNTVIHKGLTSVLAYLIYARYIAGSSIKDTMTGLVKKNRQESENVNDGAIRVLRQEARDVAVAKFQLVKEYLSMNSNTYPEWECGSNRRQFKPRMINLRKTYY
jgi:hypothetical protein